jgi:hypothetical protein
MLGSSPAPCIIPESEPSTALITTGPSGFPPPPHTAGVEAGELLGERAHLHATLEPGEAIQIPPLGIWPDPTTDNAAISNHSTVPVDVSTAGGIAIEAPAGNALILTHGLAWQGCDYGAARNERQSTGPANRLVCMGGATNAPYLDFTTIPWDPDVPLTLAVTYPPGWNLVGAPSLTPLTGDPWLPVYAFGPPRTGYIAQFGAEALSGQGYWVYFDSTTTLPLAASGPQTATILPTGFYEMIGNPGESEVSVSGADALWTYDPVAQTYEPATTLQPGQGAWAWSAGGGTLTLTPTGK